MGTNYYWKPAIERFCIHCGQPASGQQIEEIHIGKSSFGWCFALHVTEEIKGLDDWKVRFSQTGSEIRDEYGIRIQPENMLEIIVDRGAHDSANDLSTKWLAENYAVRGPRGLARCKIAHRCIGHGDGTWDLITGEFS